MNKVRLSRSIVGSSEVHAVESILLGDGYLGMGKEVLRFEEDLAVFLNVPSSRVACVNSGTAALHLAVESSLSPGDEVLVQSLTFVATYQAIVAGRAVPVPCEVNPENALIDLRDAANRLTNRTKAIMPVHYASSVGDLDAVYRFAKRYGLRVIEDAAHAFGCIYKGKMVGGFGDICCFSFDGIKNITSGEGGAVISSDSEVMHRIRDARLLGIERDTEKRFAGERSWEFDVKRPGYRFHMSNILASIGRVQLRRFSVEFAPKRTRLAQLYREQLKGLSGICLLNTDSDQTVPHIQPIRVLEGRRDALRLHLSNQGIETGLHYMPNHLLSLFGAGRDPLPVTELLYKELLSLPLHPGLESDDIDRVCDSIFLFFGKT
jgi:dTDP-4-amino-4,6-dideoxygalactose transaminase